MGYINFSQMGGGRWSYCYSVQTTSYRPASQGGGCCVTMALNGAWGNVDYWSSKSNDFIKTLKLELSGYQPVTGTAGIGAGYGRTVTATMVEAKKGIGAGTLLGLTIVGMGVFGAVLFATREKHGGLKQKWWKKPQ